MRKETYIERFFHQTGPGARQGGLHRELLDRERVAKTRAVALLLDVVLYVRAFVVHKIKRTLAKEKKYALLHTSHMAQTHLSYDTNKSRKFRCQ